MRLAGCSPTTSPGAGAGTPRWPRRGCRSAVRTPSRCSVRPSTRGRCRPSRGRAPGPRRGRAARRPAPGTRSRLGGEALEGEEGALAEARVGAGQRADGGKGDDPHDPELPPSALIVSPMPTWRSRAVDAPSATSSSPVGRPPRTRVTVGGPSTASTPIALTRSPPTTIGPKAADRRGAGSPARPRPARPRRGRRRRSHRPTGSRPWRPSRSWQGCGAGSGRWRRTSRRVPIATTETVHARRVERLGGPPRRPSPPSAWPRADDRDRPEPCPAKRATSQDGRTTRAWPPAHGARSGGPRRAPPGPAGLRGRGRRRAAPWHRGPPRGGARRPAQGPTGAMGERATRRPPHPRRRPGTRPAPVRPRPARGVRASARRPAGYARHCRRG